MRRAALSFLLCAALAASGKAEAAIFYPETATLANGLTVVVIPNKLSPAAVQMLWYKTGAADDPQGQGGLAHYLEHMLFKGTDKVPEGAFSAAIAALGGDDNAFTSYDYTAYHETVPAEKLALVMQMEADRMRGLLFEDSSAASELAVVKSERGERIDNHPQGLFSERFRAALWGSHPYGRPVIGARADLDALTPAAARAFYRTHYAPQNALLVVSGNVAFGEVLRLAAATFGRIEGGAVRAPAPLPTQAPPEPARVEMQDKRVSQASVMAATLAPSRAHEARRSYALEVLSEVLDGGEVGLLHRAFVLERKSASGVSVSYDPTTRSAAAFSWSAVPAPNAEVRTLEKDIKAWLAAQAAAGLPPKDIASAKQRLQDAAIFARDRLAAPAQIVGEALAVGIPVAELEAWPERIGAVTAVEVNESFRALMASPHWITGILEPEGGVR